MKQAEATTQKAYPEKPEQPPGTRHTHRQGREIFASNPAKRKYERKVQAMKNQPNKAILTSLERIAG
jgi:hypothetical protein